MNTATRLVQRRIGSHDQRSSTSPLHLSATYEQIHADRFEGYDYSRTASPTRDELQQLMAELEDGLVCTAYASGMAAIHAVLMGLRSGDRVVAGDDLYGGTCRLLALEAERVGFDVVHADLGDTTALRDLLRAPTRLVWAETPSNPLQKVTDIQAVADACRRAGVRFAVDNTMMTPHLQRPLARGADYVVHSATKFLGGHGDLLAGLVVVRDAKLGAELASRQNATGNGLAAFDSWLLLRGLKTLAARLAMQRQTCGRVVRWLERHAQVRAVYWTGSERHPGFDLHRLQSRGSSPVVSFETHSRAEAFAVVESTRLFRTTVSFGSVTSTVSIPALMSHASTPGGATVPDRLVRLSIGLEEPDDLVADLDQAISAPRSRLKDLHSGPHVGGIAVRHFSR